MRYVAYDELDRVPHVIVDGSARPDTLLTLSHWPGSPTPATLRADLSAQIAFRYLRHPELAVPARAVSNNHFDQDGLAAVFALVDPDGATAREQLVVDVARAGDFAAFESRDAARIAFTIPALAEELDGADPYPALLERLPELLDHPDRFREHWQEEDAHLAESEAAIAGATVTIDELPDLDLAIVTVPEAWAERRVHRFTQLTDEALHPMAVHNATDRLRILTRRGAAYDLRLRYETWVQLASRRPLLRPDLHPFAAALTERETAGGHWTFDGAGGLAPRLHLVGAPSSAVDPETFLDLLVDALCHAEIGWDPYA